MKYLKKILFLFLGLLKRLAFFVMGFVVGFSLMGFLESALSFAQTDYQHVALVKYVRSLDNEGYIYAATPNDCVLEKGRLGKTEYMIAICELKIDGRIRRHEYYMRGEGSEFGHCSWVDGDQGSEFSSPCY